MSTNKYNQIQYLNDMDKLDEMMGIVNLENGRNKANLDKLLSIFNICIKCHKKLPNMVSLDASTGTIIDLKYLKNQKKILVNHMKAMGF